MAIPTRFATELTVSVLESMFTFPVTVKEPKAPTLVMLGWAAVCIVPVRVDAVTPAVTAREDKVPTLVMLGWAAV